MIQITADTRRAVVTNKELLTTGSAGIQVQFAFSEDWDGLSKFAIFRNGDDGQEVPVALPNSNLVVIPAQSCSEDYVDETVFVGVYGSDGVGGVIIPTIWVSLGVLRPGAVTTDIITPPQPTPDMWAQILAIANNAVAIADECEENETLRVAAEELRASAESLRATAEQARADAEAQRAAAEQGRSSSELTRQSQESARAEAEILRAQAEVLRQQNETSRATAETARASAEQTRQSQESTRVSNETARITAEQGRASAESGRVTAETNRVSAESSRASAETSRASAEQSRATAETERASAESSRATAENARIAAEQSRANAETDRVTAETNRATEFATWESTIASKVPNTRTINGKALSADITLDSGDIAYDDSETYQSSTAGYALNDLTRQISDVEENQIPELKSAITLKTDDLYNILEAYQSVFQKGFWATGTGVYNGTRSDYVCTKNPIPVKEGDVITVSNIPQTSGYCFYMRYAPDMSYINHTQMTISAAGKSSYTVPSGVGFVHFSITKGNGTTINPLDYTNVVTVSINNARSRKFESIENLLKWDCSTYFRSKFVTHMSHNGDGTYGNNTKRNAIVSPLHFDSDITVIVGSGLKIAYQIFDGYTTGSSRLVSASAWITTSTTIKAGTYWCMIVAYTSEANTTDTIQNDLTFEMNLTADDVYAKLLGEDVDIGRTFVVGTDSVKRKLTTAKIGTLKYNQSFCMYNGNYYSTDGSNIGVQDSSFADVSTVELSVGHGNNFQLGNNGKAYISGWNDNKVYVINMETLTIDSTINLGTTGYTTAVIDDLNKIAYIFQRDSYPDTIVNYNFIVYDYQNQQVKSTKVINAFGALQSVDFHNGKIIAIWGLGTPSVNSGMAVYDTSGNILAEYFLDVIGRTEPEGVFIDRKYGDLLISIENKSVYKITV